MTGAENRPGLVILTGPTAVGKSELSVSLAGQIGGEIISADSMQVYRHMDIGSAKIMPDQMGGIPHHLIDVLEPTEEFNVVSFQQLAKKALQDIYARGRLPVVADRYLCARLEETAAAQGSEALYERLRSIDPESCESIHAHNVKRVIRAIEFYEKTGTKISEHNRRQRERTSPYNFAYFVLTDDRERLYGRIEARIDRMLEEGLVEEVAALAAAGCTREMVSMQGLGYKEILDYLDGKATLEEAIYTLKRDTRHFAKRQLTWFRRERDVIWINKKEFGYDDGQILTYIGEVLHEKGIRCSLDGTRTENKAGR